MHTAKSLSEFHFDTVKSGSILHMFLEDAKISRTDAAKRIGLSYDALVDSLKGKNKDSKMELVVKVCYLSGRTLREWCELMLDGVNEDVAAKVLAVFARPMPVAVPNIDDAINHCLDVQERSSEHYQSILRACYDELRVSKEQMQQQMQQQIDYLQQENRRLLDALLARS